MVVMVQEEKVGNKGIFSYLALGQIVFEDGEIYLKPCARYTQLLALNKSYVALRSVNNISQESYDFAATPCVSYEATKDITL
jgi:hypothetical protein